MAKRRVDPRQMSLFDLLDAPVVAEIVAAPVVAKLVAGLLSTLYIMPNFGNPLTLRAVQRY
jgi:hypothetical protein